ncbi:hypothetical protein N9K12_03580 [Methylophilaceae bacterium]|jgi:hypothetical protein|nr:hypothetical protein [uncultured bacterium]MDA9085873.1 hypothetical protein [Methylophilaceae bacterium]
MAYNIDGLSPAGAQSKAGDAPQMWTYKSADAKATVAASGYFNSVSSVLKVGDLVMIYDTATPAASLHIVLTNTAAGVVDVSAGTDLSVA